MLALILPSCLQDINSCDTLDQVSYASDAVGAETSRLTTNAKSGVIAAEIAYCESQIEAIKSEYGTVHPYPCECMASQSHSPRRHSI